MACLIVATPGASTANSYATIAEADAYHETHTQAAVWTDATEDLKCRALQTATRLIDTHIDWDGSVVTDTQSLLWPRNGMIYRSGYFIPNTVIPEDLKRATSEFARQLLADDRSADSDVETQGLSRLTAGPVTLEFRAGVQAKVIPDAVWYLLEFWGKVKQRGRGNIALQRI